MHINHRALEEEVWREIQLQGDHETAPKKHSKVLEYVSTCFLSQFRRLAYFWFLAISVLECLGPEHDFRMLLPFDILLLLGVTIQVFQDRSRAETKVKQQRTKYQVWTGTSMESLQTKELRAGHIISLQNGELAPADVLILATGRLDQSAVVDAYPYYGISKCNCIIAVSETQRIIKSVQLEEAMSRLLRLKGVVKVTQPSPDIGVFRGRIKLEGYPTATVLSLSNVVLKGSRLCYTPWAFGLVLYAGADCKVAMNRRLTRRFKSSRIETRLNVFFVYYIGVVCLLAVLNTALEQCVAQNTENGWLQFKAFLLLYAQAVPASLYLILDVARLMHVLFFCTELNYDPRQLWPRNLRLAEALGQVEYVLTDKTGTLTENNQSLKVVGVGQTEYTKCDHPTKLHKQLCLSLSSQPPPRLFRRNSPTDLNIRAADDEEDLCGFKELKTLIGQTDASSHLQMCEHMALCNVVTVTTEQEYKSQSRADLALMQGAVDLGAIIHEKTEKVCRMTIGEIDRTYTIVETMNYKPSLKRMRVLLQDKDTNEGVLLLKGAADVMLKLINLNPEDADRLDRRTSVLTHDRIRVFIYAYKSFAPQEISSIIEKLEMMRTSSSNYKKIEGMFKELEKDSTYLGFAGLEDPISEQTVCAVHSLLDANIKVWVLSGDRETRTLAAASEIGLLRGQLSIAHIGGQDLEAGCKQALIQAVRTYVLRECLSGVNSASGFDSLGNDISPVSIHQPHTPGLQRFAPIHNNKAFMLNALLQDVDSNFGVSIDGTSFRTALKNIETRELLCALLFTAKTVCFNSMLPHQKALAVRLVRDNFYRRPVTMAIGDEANDISMIQEADIGVTVRRNENREVGGISDVEVSSFSVVSELILNQGKISYANVAKMLVLWIYASAVPAELCLIYTYFCDFSGTGIIPPELWILYIMFIGMLTLVIGLFDTESGRIDHIQDSEERQSSPRNELFSASALIRGLLTSILHAGLIFLFNYSAAVAILTESGFTSSFDFLATSQFLSMAVAAVIHVIIQAESVSVLLAFSVVSVSGSLVFALNYLLTSQDNDAVFLVIFSSPVTFLGECAAVGICALVSYGLDVYQKVEKPSDEEQHNPRDESFPEPNTKPLEKTESCTTLAQLYIDTPNWSKMNEHSSYKLHEKWLHFSSPTIETEYRQEALFIYLRKPPIFLFAGCLGVYIVYTSLVLDFLLGQVILYFLTIVYLCASTLLRVNLLCISIALFGVITGKFAVEQIYEYTDILSFAMPVVIALFLVTDWRHTSALLGWNLVTVYCTVALYIRDQSDTVDSTAYAVATLIAMTCFSLSLIVFNYLNEKESRTSFKLLKLTKLTSDRTKDVLNCLIPSFVRTRMMSRDLPIALDQDLVTVLFCDICDFDAICNVLNAQQLINFLDDLFKKLDDMCDTYGLAKVETVGKTYLACAGLKERENELSSDLKLKNHAVRTVEMAIEIMNLFKEFSINSTMALQANIGINSGPVIAGVVGSEKPQFALIGDTVNTASRMSSTAPYPSSIQISADTYELLGDCASYITLTPRRVPVKGKGEMLIYQVTESEDQRITDAIDLGRLRARNWETITLVKSGAFGNWQFSALLNGHVDAALARTESAIEKHRKNQTEFKATAVPRFYNRLTWGFGLICAVALSETALWTTEYVTTRSTELWPHICILILCLSFESSFQTVARCSVFPLVSMTLGLGYSIVVTYSDTYFESAHTQHTVLVQVLLIVYFQAYGALYFKHSVLFFVLLVVYWIGTLGMSDCRYERIGTALSIAPVAVLTLFYAHRREHILKVYINFERNVSEEMQKTNELTSKMMPPHVYESLLNEKHKADVLAGVTLIFADIVGFTALSSHKTPSEMVHILSDLFSRFDHSAASNHIYKVHTIGDCYVAMGYTGLSPGRDANEECLNILQQAFDMLQALKDLNEENPGLGLDMRIGMHTGNIIAGIAGAKIVRYDIYGPDVMIANKMESYGSAGRVQVSDVTKQVIDLAAPDEYAFEYHTTMELKSIQRTHSGYFIERNFIEADTVRSLLP